jgi:hypothetical protein
MFRHHGDRAPRICLPRPVYYEYNEWHTIAENVEFYSYIDYGQKISRNTN